MKYKRIVVSKRGPPENLQIIECDLRDPSAQEVRVKVLACCVCLPDVQVRYGLTPACWPGQPKVPFTPGYAIVGVVDAAGPGVTQATAGDRVAAYLVLGGYAEYVYVREDQIIPFPPALNPAEAVPLVLNYVTAYQSLHRSAKIKAGDKVLIIGASGGIGTAFLQLGRLARLTMYGIASKSKHPILAEYGATAIDYHTQDFVAVIRRAEPGGLDAIFDGVGGDYIGRAFPLLRRGGVLVEYGNPLSMRGVLRVLAKMLVLNLLPNGQVVKLYGATAFMIFNRKPFLEDWAVLFRLLQEGKIRPVISGEFPLLEAGRANALLESGQVVGNLVLLAPELLEASKTTQEVRVNFINCYEDLKRASAYATLEVANTYYLAFRDLPAILAKHVTGSRALDFGCGTGRSTRLLQKSGFNVTGVDISEDMLRIARAADPVGDYRLVPGDNLSEFSAGTFDLVLSAFTFDNIPQAIKARIFSDLCELLSPNGVIVSIVSSPEIYIHEWASFTTKAFPENASARSGDVVRIIVTDHQDRRPVEDIVCTDETYREVYRQAGLEAVEMLKPLAKGDEPHPWASETRIAPWVIYVLKRAR